MKIALKIKNVLRKAFSKEKKIIRSENDYDRCDDYVSEDKLDQISGDSISLYQCEMPAEKLAKMKALQNSTLDRKELPHGIRNQSFSISDLKNSRRDHHRQLPTYSQVRMLQQSDLMPPQMKLVGAKEFACGMSIYPSNEDYMNMEEPNYDDYMYFCETYPSSQSQGLSVMTCKDIPPPYSEKDPIQ